jgi:isopenicillin N synthase-like dioxygenase
MNELHIDKYIYMDYIKEPFITLNLIHYPATQSNVNDGIYGIYPHSDWGFLTFLYTDEIGLQILNGDTWIDIPLEKNKFIINVGDMMEVLTCGKLKSTNHRVLVRNKEKYSIALFYEPNLNSIIKPYFLNSTYGEIKFGEYVGNKINSTYLQSD